MADDETPLFPLTPGSAPLRNDLDLPEADPRFGDEMSREVRDSAAKRLAALERMLAQLQAEARQVVGGARRDLDLHAVPLNGTKLRGRAYHLFESPGGARFFSLLGPDEYAQIDARIAHRGTYRLNHDSSWTRLDGDDAAEQQTFALRGPTLLKHEDGSDET
jgi:hypothetical protein